MHVLGPTIKSVNGFSHQLSPSSEVVSHPPGLEEIWEFERGNWVSRYYVGPASTLICTG